MFIAANGARSCGKQRPFLREFLLKSRTGYLSFEQTKSLLMPVVSTVSKLHEMGVFHCGISPNTLRLGRDGKIRLTDFMIL